MSAFSDARRRQIVERAENRCEYCHLPTTGQVSTFPIDHIIPRTQGGSHRLDNLALACPRCNAHKWKYVDSIDPLTGHRNRFFHPRYDIWSDHFHFDRETAHIEGTSGIGFSTIEGLQMNHPDSVQLRLLLIQLGLF